MLDGGGDLLQNFNIVKEELVPSVRREMQEMQETIFLQQNSYIARACVCVSTLTISCSVLWAVDCEKCVNNSCFFYCFN